MHQECNKDRINGDTIIIYDNSGNQSQVIKNRSRDISTIYNEYLGKLNEKWLNWEGTVFCNKYQKNLEYPFGGRNLYYLPIISSQGIIGSSRKVKIIAALNHSLIGV